MESVSDWKKKRGSPPLSSSGVTSVGTGKISNLLTPQEEPTVQEAPVAPQTGLVPVSQWKKSRPVAPVVPQINAPTIPKQPKNDSFFSRLMIATNQYKEDLKKNPALAVNPFSGQDIGSRVLQSYAVDALNSEPGKKVTKEVSDRTSKLGLKAIARIESFGRKTYEEALAGLEKKAQDPTNDRLERILYQGLGDSIPQTAIIVGLGLVVGRFLGPLAGRATQAALNTANAAEEERQRAGEITTMGLGNIAIDTIGDQILGGYAEKLLGKFGARGASSLLTKEGLKNFFKASTQAFGIEGSTEVLQSIGKYLNEYRAAKTDQERKAITAAMTEYMKSGQMLDEFLIGGLAGGIVGGSTSIIGGNITDPSLQPKGKGGTPERELVDVSAPAPATSEEMQLRIEEEARRIAGETGDTQITNITGDQTNINENITSGFRGGPASNPPVGKTAQDILTYEQVELGNADVVPVPGIDLEKIKSENTLWLTRTRQQAERYGDDIQEVKGNFRVLAVDSEGGVLVEKLGQPEAKKPTAKQTRPKDVGKAYAPGAKRIAEIFDQSTEQKKVAKGKRTDFVIGTFGRNHQYRKLEEKKYDRFEESELPATLKRATEAFRASNDETNYRYDNIVWVSKMPNGELRAVYTRQNKAGQEEIIAWHKISKEKAEKYISTLRSYGIPGRNRTSNLSVRSGTLYPLGDGDTKSVPRKKVTRQEKKAPVKKAVKTTVQEISADITSKYRETTVYNQALSYVGTEIEIAEVAIAQDGEGGYFRTSSYPKWIPDRIRKEQKGGIKKLFLKMLPDIDGNVSIPTRTDATKQRMALDAILAQIDQMTGVDTSAERQAAYDAIGDDLKAIKADTSKPIMIEAEISEKSVYDSIEKETGFSLKKNTRSDTMEFSDGKGNTGLVSVSIATANEPFESDDGTQFHRAVVINSIDSFNKGTGVGSKVVEAIENFASKNGMDVVINNDQSGGYWTSRGYDFLRGSVAKGIDNGGETRHEEDLSGIFQRKSDIQKREIAFGVLKDNPTVISKDEAIAFWKRYFPEEELAIEFVEKLYDYMGDPVAGVTFAQMTKIATGEGIALETVSHEAVHRFLMTFADKKSRKRYRQRAWQSLLREKAKEKDGIQNIQKQLRELNEAYRGRLNAEQLEGMLAEEYLADNFLKYLQKQEQISKMSFFRRMFEKARQFILRFSPSSAERLYDDITKVRRNLEGKRDFWQELYFQGMKEKHKSTTKTLEFIKSQVKKDTVSKQTIEQYLNREGVTAADKEIIKDTLDSIPGDTVNVGEFFAGAYARIIPLQVIRSTHWAEYGSGALASIKQEDRGRNELKGKGESHVWDAPYWYEYHPNNIHWPELYRKDMPTPKREDFVIEHSVGEHEGLTQNIWAVMRKTSARYQESDVVGTFGTKESAEAWLEDFIKNGANVRGTGLFGHTRTIYVPPKSIAKEWMEERLEPYRIKAQAEKEIADKAEKFLKELKRRSDEFADVVMRESMAQPTTAEEASRMNNANNGSYSWYRNENIVGFLAEVAGSVGFDMASVSGLGSFTTDLIPINGGQFILYGRSVHPDKMWWMSKKDLDEGPQPLSPNSFIDPALYFKEKPEDRQVKFYEGDPVDMKTRVRDFISDHMNRVSLTTLKDKKIIPPMEALIEYDRARDNMQGVVDSATDDAQYLVVEVQGDPWQTHYPYISPWATQKEAVKDYELLFKMVGEGLPVPEWEADKRNLEGRIIEANNRYVERLMMTLDLEKLDGPKNAKKVEELNQMFLVTPQVRGGKIHLVRKNNEPNGGGASPAVLNDLSDEMTKKVRDQISMYLAEAKEKLEQVEKTVTKEERQFVAMGAKFHERALKEEIRLAAQIAEETGKPVKFRVATPFTISMIEGHVPNAYEYYVKDGVLITPKTSQKADLQRRIGEGQLLTRDNFAPEDYDAIKERINEYLGEDVELTVDEMQEELDNKDAFLLLNGESFQIKVVAPGEYAFESVEVDIAPYETDQRDLSVGDEVRYLSRDYTVVQVERGRIKIARTDRVETGDVQDEVTSMVDGRIEDMRSSNEGEHIKDIVGSEMAQKWLDGELEINGVKLDKPDRWELRVVLEEIVDKDDETATFDDVEDEVRQRLYESEEDYVEESLRGRFDGGVFFEDNGYGTTYYGIMDDADEQDFYEPDSYDQSRDDAIVNMGVSIDLNPSKDKKNGEKKVEDLVEIPKTNARGEYAFDPEVLKDSSGDRYYVHQYYNKVVIPWFIKYRKDAKLHTDERGLQSWETEIKPEDAGPVVAFQRLPNDPTNEQTKPIEFPELVRLATDLMGDYPKVPKKLKAKLERGNFRGAGSGEINLSPDIFDPATQVDGFQFARTLAHEIGHLIDWLPDKTLNRGNLLGRLASLRDFRKEFLPDHPGRENKALREEMYALSKKWRPFDETTAPDSFLKYRKSGKEIYADFISALFNDPAMVRNDAPQAYNLFFQKLDAKPVVRDAYFGLQLQLRNMPDILKARREGVQEMFTKADYNSVVKQQLYEDEAEKRRKSLWQRFKYDYIDVTEPIREKVKAQKEKGVELNPDERPDLLLEEYNYLSGLIKGTVEDKFQPIFKTLADNGLTETDLGEVMFYERILFGDRGTVANPGGLQPDFVKELYGDIGQVEADGKVRDFSESMRTQLGDQKFNLLRSLAAQYRAAIKEVMLRGHKEGLYSDELAALMQSNAYYVPFRGARYSGDRMSFAVKHQIGTLGPVENPAITGLVKVVEVIRAIERNNAKKATIKLLEKTGDVLPAKTIWNGRYNEPVDPQDRFLQLITIMDGGKVSGYYVDKYIAQSFERSSAQQLGLATSALRAINSMWYRPVFITFNLGFQSFNLVRDFMRYWKNIPGMTLIKAAQNYVKAGRVAKVRTFGSSGSANDLAAMRELIKLEKERILGITMNDALMGREEEDTQLEHILKTYHVLPKTAGRFGRLSNTVVFGGLDKVLTMVENLGNFIETLPKVAGVYALEGKMKPEEMRSYVRRKIGSPDFLAGGKNKPVMNEIFLFSNAILQGIRADAEVATDPTTRAGYWYKTAQVNIVPKILMMMALAGLLGEELKKLFEKVSEYDLTNYTVIPLGTDQNGKVVYIRIPSDETGRFIGGVFWKGMKVATGDADAWKTLTQVLSYTGGQLPSVTPVIEGTVNTMQFLAGQNPYDFFRGRPVLSDEEMAAGGTVAGKKFAAFLFEQMGGGIFLKLYTNEPFPKEKSPGEAVFQLPVAGNVINRWVKISNVGQYQRDREVINELRQEEARTTIKQRDIMFDYLEQAIGKSSTEVAQIERDMIEETVGKIDSKEKKEQADSLRKRFRLLRIRGEASTEIDMIASMRTNDEKAVLLGRYRSRMEQAEFDSMVRFLVANKIISSDVLRKMYGLEAQ